ncbi:MAG: 5'-nucleotidase SurE [Gammaproteobacteria bacterium]|nr:5'-nucleotidase SurE [Gammaproteobacteria bacterium]
MHFLLSNDDGYQARGLELLAEAVAKLGKVTVVAPDRNRSGASNSLTLDAPLYAQTAANGFIFVNGTPTDCVHLAITGLLEPDPDMVISGINSGANLGDDILYSGTVAAAMEGRFLGCPAIAVSMVGPNPVYYDTGVRVVLKLVKSLAAMSRTTDVLLNVNVPDLPYDQLGTFEITRLGHRHKSEPAIRTQDPHGRSVFWVGPVGQGQDAGPGTDFYAVKNNNVSITPLHVDLTLYSALDELTQWVEGISKDEN